MSHERVLVANTAQNFWLALIDLAMLSDWQSHVAACAKDSGFSQASIEKRCRAVRWFLDNGLMPEAIAEMGAERTVSDWQKAVNQVQAKGPGDTVNFTVRMDKESKRECDEMLKAIRAVSGASNEDAMLFLARLIHGSDSAEIQHQWQVIMGSME